MSLYMHRLLWLLKALRHPLAPPRWTHVSHRTALLVMFNSTTLGQSHTDATRPFAEELPSRWILSRRGRSTTSLGVCRANYLSLFHRRRIIRRQHARTQILRPVRPMDITPPHLRVPAQCMASLGSTLSRSRTSVDQSRMPHQALLPRSRPLHRSQPGHSPSPSLGPKGLRRSTPRPQSIPNSTPFACLLLLRGGMNAGTSLRHPVARQATPSRPRGRWW